MEVIDYRKANGHVIKISLEDFNTESLILYLLTRKSKSRLFKINSQVVSGVVTDCDFKVSSIED